jgi:hypothetical protein
MSGSSQARSTSDLRSAFTERRASPLGITGPMPSGCSRCQQPEHPLHAGRSRSAS